MMDKFTRFELALARLRLKNRLHELFVAEFTKQHRAGAVSVGSLARRISREPAYIWRCLREPVSNRLEDWSDLFLGLGCRLSFGLVSLPDDEPVDKPPGVGL